MNVETIVLLFFAFYAVSMFGLAYIVGHAAITREIRARIFGQWARAEDEMPASLFLRRKIVELFECPACFGFWTGVAMSISGNTPFEVFILNPIAWGLFTAGSNYIFAKITKLID